MKYYFSTIIFSLFFCHNYSYNNYSNRIPKIVQQKNISASINGIIKKNNQSKEYSITDTITTFIKESLYDGSFTDFSFCQKELVKILNDNDSCRNVWRKKLKNYFTMYDYPLDYISAGKEFLFFKKRLLENSILQKEYPKGYRFLIKSIPNNEDTLLNAKQYQELFLRFKNAGEANVEELTDIYYTLFIIDGFRFIKAIEENSECKKLFKKWINNIEESEFTAYSGNELPPQIIERKREYLINKYSSSHDPLMREAINKIKNAKIRIIN
ncbi:MAG: hypothetical protein ACYCOO_12215 [Chitinophagaceae bacterium]